MKMSINSDAMHNITLAFPNEERYRQIVETQVDMICRYTPDFRLLFVNRTYAESYGMTAPEMIGMNILDMIPETDRKAAVAHIQQLTPENPVAISEHRSLRPDGRIRWIHWTDAAFFDPKGSLVEIQGVGRDITEQKQAAAEFQRAYNTLEQRLMARIVELNHSKERVEAILNNSFDSVLLAYTDLRIQQTNPAFNRLFVCDFDDYFGTSLLDLVHPDSAELVKETVQGVIKSRAGQKIEARLRRRDASYFPAELSFGYIKELDYKIDGLVCTLRDITDRKERERQLRYHASLQENVNDAVIATDMDFRIQSWNPAAETIYGWKAAEVLGQPIEIALQTQFDSSQEMEEISQQLLEDGWWHGEVMQHHKDGSEIYILSSVTLMRDEDGTPLGVVVANRDITERRKVEQTLRQTLEREKELNEMKSRFVSMASHEFRTPLAIILSSAEMMLRYRQRLPEEQLERRLNIITEQVHYLTDLVGDVLDLEKMRSGRSDFQLVEVDLVALCHEIIEDFHTQSQIKHRLTFTHEHSSVVLKLDKRLIRQVMTNLISNAIKYSPNAQNVWITLTQTDHDWQLDVRDEGIGIPPADLEWLFEPFHRAANADKIPGTGLGLSITRQAVEMHGGRITVESRMGVGTTFSVHLPLPVPQ